MDEWKSRRNKVSELSLAEFIQNTIDEEINKVMCDIPTSEIIDNTAEAKELREEGYYRAIAILNEVL